MLNFSAEFRYLILENSKHKEIRWQISAMKHLFSLYFLIERDSTQNVRGIK